MLGCLQRRGVSQVLCVIKRCGFAQSQNSTLPLSHNNDLRLQGQLFLCTVESIFKKYTMVTAITLPSSKKTFFFFTSLRIPCFLDLQGDLSDFSHIAYAALSEVPSNELNDFISLTSLFHTWPRELKFFRLTANKRDFKWVRTCIWLKYSITCLSVGHDGKALCTALSDYNNSLHLQLTSGICSCLLPKKKNPFSKCVCLILKLWTFFVFAAVVYFSTVLFFTQCLGWW